MSVDAPATTQQLDDAELAHLLDLAKAADGVPASGRSRRRSSSGAAARPSLQWAAHDVRIHGSGTTRFHRPVAGELTLAHEELAITADPGLVLLISTAGSGSASAERRLLLASWAAAAVPHSPTGEAPEAPAPERRPAPPRRAPVTCRARRRSTGRRSRGRRPAVSSSSGPRRASR